MKSLYINVKDANKKRKILRARVSRTLSWMEGPWTWQRIERRNIDAKLDARGVKGLPKKRGWNVFGARIP